MQTEKTARKVETANVSPLDDLLNKPVSSFDLLLDTDQFSQIERTADVFARASVVPDHWKGQPESIFAALCRAYSLEVDPMMFLENAYEVHGRIGISSQLQIALVNKSRVLEAPIDWRVEGEGKTLAVTAYATLAANGREISRTVTHAQAVADGWAKNAKYQTIPEQMLRWRAASWLIRLYCPEIVLGMYTPEELQDAANDEKRAEQVAALDADIETLKTMSADLNINTAALLAEFNVASLDELAAQDVLKCKTRILELAQPRMLRMIENKVDSATAAANFLAGPLRHYRRDSDVYAAFNKRLAEIKQAEAEEKPE